MTVQQTIWLIIITIMFSWVVVTVLWIFRKETRRNYINKQLGKVIVRKDRTTFLSNMVRIEFSGGSSYGRPFSIGYEDYLEASKMILKSMETGEQNTYHVCTRTPGSWVTRKLGIISSRYCIIIGCQRMSAEEFVKMDMYVRSKL